ncbi:DUF2788 domain-containing protein [Algicola sagamiensis]|uniref:DUF2788 domain-containing protein n=1 Tax=Algicola sagamiensis TaxID=163869 RepID=UPI00036E8523|nr:DUF2788 domain-containing protein [Algicola sagamiensis]
MQVETIEQLESFFMNLAFAGLFALIGLAIKDVLDQADVPKFGRWMVWLVLFLGCAGFLAKGVIQLVWSSMGTG